ncbi:hypothetical protein [Bacteroides pyogenes]|uniref:hypothetical protein n=2 Tax=Bacteroides pyogenes TaxID=310300 RepID=UPI000E161A09|nr:hypothetical protein [Bacteroides pyogenes]SUV33194.1 Uncharacterised protein [Bacteroides pyogenes]
MKAKILFVSLLSILFACNSADMNSNFETGLESNAPNQVLLLRVDYTTNTFEGGTILGFDKKTEDFTIENEYVVPSDFGSVKLIYKELWQPLFEGTIHWMGRGKMTFPKKLQPASAFKHISTYDLRYPIGFENVFNPDNRELDYDKPWISVQGLAKTREFLTANPTQKAKLFLYTPSVGAGDPKDWYWLIYLKK